MSHSSRIAENLARVRERIAAAAHAAGRDPASIRLVAVSKYVDATTAAALLAAGCTDLGESRPQELWDKVAAPELAGARWHLIGRLQRNKVRRTLPLVDDDSQRRQRAPARGHRRASRRVKPHAAGAAGSQLLRRIRKTGIHRRAAASRNVPTLGGLRHVRSPAS